MAVSLIIRKKLIIKNYNFLNVFGFCVAIFVFLLFYKRRKKWHSFFQKV